MRGHEVWQWVEALRSKFPGEVPRFLDAGAPLSHAWSPDELRIEPAEQAHYLDLDLDFDQHSITGEFYDEFFEEAHLLRAQLEAGATPETLGVWPAAWHPLSDSGAQRVIALWETFAVPLRYRGGRVYRIWSPLKTITEPIVKSMPAEEFVCAVAAYMAHTSTELAQMRTRIARLKEAVTILALLAGMFVLMLLIG